MSWSKRACVVTFWGSAGLKLSQKAIRETLLKRKIVKRNKTIKRLRKDAELLKKQAPASPEIDVKIENVDVCGSIITSESLRS
ncbi:hypothetical protein B0T22DRAFT_490046 [Podospora appendiculata]|uniref:Uncharacterized protein n=1 Tax=Podospora appendiculata TaxID=314037 RepID=A0AAE1CC74_9PEZI|nr:hypothetical protein B0T22DRAFT_490046 [Podospora appendiculata]